MYIALFRHHPAAPIAMDAFSRPSEAMEFRSNYLNENDWQATCVIVKNIPDRELITAIEIEDVKLRKGLNLDE